MYNAMCGVMSLLLLMMVMMSMTMTLMFRMMMLMMVMVMMMLMMVVVVVLVGDCWSDWEPGVSLHTLRAFLQRERTSKPCKWRAGSAVYLLYVSCEVGFMTRILLNCVFGISDSDTSISSYSFQFCLIFSGMLLRYIRLMAWAVHLSSVSK